MACSIFLFMMYPLMLGGYPEAIGVFENEPGLMAVLNSVAFFIFYVGNAVLFLGLGMAFTLGSTTTGGMRSWVTTTGAVLCLVGLVGMIGGLFGIGAMMVLAPFGVIATLLSSYLGYSIWRAGARPDQYRLERLLVTVISTGQCNTFSKAFCWCSKL
jgi:hypothetical protein